MTTYSSIGWEEKEKKKSTLLRRKKNQHCKIPQHPWDSKCLVSSSVCTFAHSFIHLFFHSFFQSLGRKQRTYGKLQWSGRKYSSYSHISVLLLSDSPTNWCANTGKVAIRVWNISLKHTRLNTSFSWWCFNGHLWELGPSWKRCANREQGLRLTVWPHLLSSFCWDVSHSLPAIWRPCCHAVPSLLTGSLQTVTEGTPWFV